MTKLDQILLNGNNITMVKYSFLSNCKVLLLWCILGNPLFRKSNILLLENFSKINICKILILQYYIHAISHAVR